MKHSGNKGFSKAFVKASAKASAGASLIEVLVALSIFSLGMSGLSAMQLATLEHSRALADQHRAALLGNEMAERLHALAAEGGPFADAIAAWRAEVATALPGGAAAACLDGTPSDGDAAAPACDGAGDDWAVKIWWHENGDENAPRSRITILRP